MHRRKSCSVAPATASTRCPAVCLVLLLLLHLWCITEDAHGVDHPHLPTRACMRDAAVKGLAAYTVVTKGAWNIHDSTVQPQNSPSTAQTMSTESGLWLAIIEFLGEEATGVVPTSWISEGGSQCRWPPQSMPHKKLEAMVKNNKPPGKWKSRAIRVVGYASTYEQALRRWDRSLYTSSVESEGDIEFQCAGVVSSELPRNDSLMCYASDSATKDMGSGRTPSLQMEKPHGPPSVTDDLQVPQGNRLSLPPPPADVRRLPKVGSPPLPRTSLDLHHGTRVERLHTPVPSTDLLEAPQMASPPLLLPLADVHHRPRMELHRMPLASTEPSQESQVDRLPLSQSGAMWQRPVAQTESCSLSQLPPSAPRRWALGDTCPSMPKSPQFFRDSSPRSVSQGKNWGRNAHVDVCEGSREQHSPPHVLPAYRVVPRSTHGTDLGSQHRSSHGSGGLHDPCLPQSSTESLSQRPVSHLKGLVRCSEAPGAQLSHIPLTQRMSEPQQETEFVQDARRSSSEGSESSGESSSLGSCHTSHGLTGRSFEKSVLTLLVDLKHCVKTLGRRVEDITNTLAQQDNGPGCSTLPCFPICTDGELQQFEEALLDERVKRSLIAMLSRIGGSSLQESVRIIMKRLLRNCVALQYSLRGAQAKKDFSSLRLFGCIIAALLTRYNTVTEKEIENKIGRFLAGASDREGGRESRRQRRLPAAANPPVTATCSARI